MLSLVGAKGCGSSSQWTGFRAHGWDLWDQWVGLPGRPSAWLQLRMNSLSLEVCKTVEWKPYSRSRTWVR